MSDCSNHKKEVAGISDMRQLAGMIGDLHYETLATLFQHLYRKIETDAGQDNRAGREKLAAALQYAGMGVFEAALRLEKVWKVCEPFMESITPQITDHEK